MTKAFMTNVILELFIEGGRNRELANRAGDGLRILVARLAPHIVLDVSVLNATDIRRHRFPWGGVERDVPYHAPTSPGRQTLLMTDEPIGAQGWGWPGCGVVSIPALNAKRAAGGDIADIVIHEWIHTLQGMIINGRPVPFADDAERLGYTSVTGADGEPTWHAWFRFALGGEGQSASPSL